MATWTDVERIALSLPQTSAGKAWNRPAFLVHKSWFVLEREPLKDAVNDRGEWIEGLIVLYTEDEETKLRLAGDDSGYFMTTPHFDRSRMILVHLDRIPVDELAEVLIESWLVKAPKRVAAAYLASLPPADPVADLQAHGWTIVHVATVEGESVQQAQRSIAAALRLRSPGERNLDAMADLLDDLHLRWPGVTHLALVWRGLAHAQATDPKRAALLVGVLEEAQHRPLPELPGMPGLQFRVEILRDEG